MAYLQFDTFRCQQFAITPGEQEIDAALLTGCRRDRPWGVGITNCRATRKPTSVITMAGANVIRCMTKWYSDADHSVVTQLPVLPD